MEKQERKISPDALVKESPLFSVLGANARADVLSLARPLSIEAGSYLYTRGGPSDRYFGILKGRVRMSVNSAEGKSVTLNHAAKGEWFGELGLFEGGNRLVDAIAVEPAELLYLGQSDMMTLAKNEPSLFLPIIELLGARIRLAGELLRDTVFQSVTFRLAKRLLDLAERDGRKVDGGILIDQHLPQEELGNMVGATREAVGRQLGVWKKHGWIDLSYGKITILNRTPLMQIVLSGQDHEF